MKDRFGVDLHVGDKVIMEGVVSGDLYECVVEKIEYNTRTYEPYEQAVVVNGYTRFTSYSSFLAKVQDPSATT